MYLARRYTLINNFSGTTRISECLSPSCCVPAISAPHSVAAVVSSLHACMHSKLVPSDAITECESNMESVTGGAEEHFSGIDENRTLDSEELQEAALRNTVRR